MTIVRNIYNFILEYLQYNSPDKDRVTGSSWILNLPDFGTKPTPRQGHKILYYENTLILYGGVGDNYQFEDDKFYQYKLDYKTWSILNISGSKPGFRVFFSMVFIKPSVFIIFGGQSTTEKNGEFNVVNDLYKIDLKENNSMTAFVAGLPPPQRFGHGSITNYIADKKEVEMLILGGLDKVYSPMDIFVLKETQLGEENQWVYEEKKYSNDQLQEKDHIFETAKNAIILYKKQLEVLETRNIEINKKHLELYNILANYKRKELEENISTNMKKNELKAKKQELESDKISSEKIHSNIREYNTQYNQLLEVLRARCIIIYEYLAEVLDAIKELDEIVNEIDKSEHKVVLFGNVDMDSLIFKRKNFKIELDSFRNFFKDVSILENELYEDIQKFEKEIKEKYNKFYYLKTDEMKPLELNSPKKALDNN